MAKAKPKILKLLIPLSAKLTKIKALTSTRKNKVGPASAAAKRNEILLERESSMSFDRRHEEYLQARRAVLSSYHLIDGGGSLKEKMKSSLKGLCRQAGAAVKGRVGVRVYRFTVARPWSGGGEVLVFRCLLPHVKTRKKPCMEY